MSLCLKITNYLKNLVVQNNRYLYSSRFFKPTVGAELSCIFILVLAGFLMIKVSAELTGGWLVPDGLIRAG